MRACLLAVVLVLSTLALAPSTARAGELGPNEVFIDPMDASGGMMSPLTPLSPRPQTELHIVPLEFLILDVNIPGALFGLVNATDERAYHYQLRIGGKVAFFKRFELGVELMPLHVGHASVTTSIGGGGRTTYSDSNANFGNFAVHFMANIVHVPDPNPLYFSAALRVTFPTAGNIVLNLDGDREPNEEIEAKFDSWIIEPHLIFGITLGDMVTLSTRQGLSMIFVEDVRRYPFLGDDQISWYMNFAVGVAPIRKWFSIVADFTALFVMNEVDYTSIERTWDDAHMKFMHVGLGAKVYPIDPLSIGLAMRFGLNDETRQSVGAYNITLNVAYEFDFAIGGITLIKEGSTAPSTKKKPPEGEGGSDEG